MNSKFSSDAIFTRSDDVLMTDSQGMTVLMSMETGKFVELSGSGGAIWKMIDGTRSVSDLVADLRGQYDVPADQCEAEVQLFIGQLVAENLVSKAG